MRKLFLSLGCALFMAGLVVAADYTVVSYKEKALTVTDEKGKEITLKITDDTKFFTKFKEDKKDGKWENVEKMLTSEKAKGRKVDLTVVDGKITEFTTTGGGKKKKE